MSKGGGGGHTPYEAPDSLKSTQLLAMIDAISEGPIKGPVNGMQSILVNNTPLVDAEGNYNIHGVTVVYRLGEHPQTALEGFEDSGAETLMGVELKHDNPITRTITSKEIDRLRFTFGVQSLVESNDKGDQNESSVNMQIQFQINGVWQLVKDIYIHGKTTTQFLASVVVSNLPPRPFNMRMVRITDDSTTSMLQNKTLWSSYTEIIDIKQTYPNTAVVGLQVDAEQFGSQQVTVNYHLEGRTVLVPSNYDPVSRTYAGLWDGTFKPAYTNNPAWCVLDLLTHPRYGMGQRIGISDVDKWALYAIAQYCDQMVPDGFGGMEPRMRCNAWLTTQRKAHDVLADFCSVMRCMPVWNGQKMTFVQDRPADRAWTYTNSNVVGGQFKYSFSALKERHNAVEVRYVDPMNGWKTSTELVEDHEAQVRYGRNVLKMDAFGCTSRGQAHRMGLWAIQTELLETQTVDFSVGAEGLRHTVGDLFEICDNDYAGASVSGRIVAVDVAARTLTLDREIEIPEHGAATLSSVGSDGLPVIMKVMSHTEPDKITVDVLPEGIAPGGVWGLKLPALRRRLFRCVVIREGENGTYGITAVQHVPEKEAIVDNGAHFDLQSGTLNGVTPPAVQHLAVDTSADSSLYQAKATWDTPRVIKGVRFVLRLTVGVGTDDDPVRLVTTVTTSETEFTFHELPYGHYTLTVSAINGYGQQGDPASVEFDIDLPEPPDFIEITPGYFSLTVAPRQKVYHPDVSFEFWFSEKQLLSADQVLAEGQYLGRGSMWIKDGLVLLGTDYWFYVRSVNLVGKSAFAEASGQVKSDAQGVLERLKGQITANLLNREFLSTIENDTVRREFEAALRISETNVQQQLETLKSTVNVSVAAELETIKRTAADEHAAVTLQMNTLQTQISTDITSKIEALQRASSTAEGSLTEKLTQLNATVNGQVTTVQEISRAQAMLNDTVAALKSFRVQYQANGKAAIAGIQLSATQTQSEILMMADRIALLNPYNGSVTLPFLIQNGQVVLADTFVKSLNINDRFVVDTAGNVQIRDSARNTGLSLNNRAIKVFDDYSRKRVQMGDLWA
ncbi:host specificity protein J [Salmonella enterica]|uniref:Phage tail protein n=6 Tax=Salmonella enterica TaxID=28901 RepID=A0A8E9YE72_SALDZ|nr:phage tail protein [Salmonella enterica]OHF71659.1 host specificity protein J [Salmonella enterica subsp. diarizonae serovar 60:r:e,n,x,z15]OHF73540.1 host specificity protein J [Salmonella enterica subsp. diarizonae serovar 60:r:e,n,x,z15]OHF82473.1 host specificity protein J [Salmonella enterica subsp. diarizonae serovar 60:r:e,n,x,z15]OHJ80490.1 host specificity protein J [Salmonella enterica]QWJ46113.1 phage tail protein [Salmonella enterica subsp. diarizonae serovar 60:r:e,n,x,z15]